MDPEEAAIAPDSEILRYRNHFSALVQSTLSTVLVIAIIFLTTYVTSPSKENWWELNQWLWIIIFFLLATVFVSIRIWMRTTYEFGPTELIVNKDTFFKNKTRIQYSKMATINVRRNIINHIFGTTTLMFNVNSSVNSMSAEASITLISDEADRLREIVSSRIFNKEMEVEADHEEKTLVNVSNFDVILHGFFGQPTASSALGLVFLAYSIIGTFFTGSGGLLGFLMFGITSVIPWVRTILRYYNYRIYRVEDTIVVESGLISNYRSSFKINKVNCVRIREPLFARLMGRSLLEAEVVGLADSEGLPLLCPLKNKRIVDELAQQLVQEFLFETSHNVQPRKSLFPTLFIRVVLALIAVAAGISVHLYAQEYMDPWSPLTVHLFNAVIVAITVAAPILLIIHGFLAQRYREFEKGEETFMFVTGAYDRQREFMRYDKVQFCTVLSGPVQRRFGVARCKVHLMSSRGARAVQSGLFDRQELESISEEVMARIRDGRYDYRRYI